MGLQSTGYWALKHAESAWQHRFAGPTLWTASVLSWVFWEIHVPSPGKAVGGLAVAAAVISVRDLKPLSKMLWMLLLCGFLHVELRAIDSDRASHDREQVEARAMENRHFQSTVDSLKEAINGMKGILSSTTEAVRLSQQNVDTITGAGSYIYFEPSILGDRPIELDAGPIKKGSLIFSAYMAFHGEFPVHDVFVHAMALDGPEQYLNYGTVFPHELGRPREGFQLGFSPTQARHIFHFVMNGSSGTFGESVLVRRIGQHCVWLARLFRGAADKPFRQWSCPDFPKELLSRSWDKD